MALAIDIICDANATSDFPAVSYVVPNPSDSRYPCVETVQITSKYGCPVTSINALWKFFYNYRMLFGGILIAFGLFICLFGRMLFKPVIFVLGLVAFVFLSMLFFYSVFFNANTKAYVGWIVLSVSAVVGILVGLLLAKFSKLGLAVLAGWGGACLGLVLWSAFLYKTNSQIAFWCIIVFIALICAGLSFCIFEHLVIIATSFVGAYGLVRGISVYAGGYPNEFTIVQLIQNGLIDQINPIFYIYLGGIVVAFIIGMIVQYKMKGKYIKKEKHPYYNLN